MINLYRDPKEIDPEKHIIATYWIESTQPIGDASYALAIGQSIGNPLIRNKLESDTLIEKHAAKIMTDFGNLDFLKSSVVNIAFPIENINWETDGVSQLMCMLMGGQMDIDIITKCHLMDINLPERLTHLRPKFGISGLRKFTGMYDRPLLGCIIKPKIGLKPKELRDVVKEMIEGGANIIKEDEILANPFSCKLEDRLPYIADLIKDKPIIYLTCINGDPDYILEKAKLVHKLGINGVHINFWSGLGSYAAVRRLDLPLVIHFQKSGDKIMTNDFNNYHVSWGVICKLASISGVDTIHTGMWGGYANDEENVLRHRMEILQTENVLPALSCGMRAEIIPSITKRFGKDYLANVGGAAHDHPDGIKAAVKKLRKAIDG